MDPTPPATQEPRDEAAPAPEDRSHGGDRVGNEDRYCRRCLYCLGDLTLPGAPSVCPECGLAFNPMDPRATLDAPRRRKSWLLRWPGLTAVVFLTVLMCSQFGLLPTPVAHSSWGMWRWRAHVYGYGEGLWWWHGLAYGTTTFRRSDQDITYTLHAGIASRVSAVATDDGRPIFSVERAGDPPVWSLRIDDHALAYPIGSSPEFIRAINDTREHRFGVTVYPPAGSTRLTPPGPIDASGTEADIFWAYVNAYGLVVDFPERVPRASDGWHPTLEPGADAVYPAPRSVDPALRPRSMYRR